MKWLLIFWAGPIVLLGTWYGLSYYDMNFGFIILSRQVHDLVFQIYGNILGIPPDELPGLVLRAVIFDSFLLFSILAFRRRRAIVAWWRARQGEERVLDNSESLSKAP